MQERLIVYKKNTFSFFAVNQENQVADRDEVTTNSVKIDSKLFHALNESASGNNNNITKDDANDNDIKDVDESKDDENKLSIAGKIQIKKEEDLFEKSKKSETVTDNTTTNNTDEKSSLHDHSVTVNQVDENIPIDWKPQKQCYFCVDGKLLTVNEKGELVAESGSSAQTEADVANHVRFSFISNFS